jgi:hypothetical protein
MPDDVRKTLDDALRAYERYQRSGRLPTETQQRPQGGATGGQQPGAQSGQQQSSSR